MKTLVVIIGTVVFFLFTGTAVGEVKIKEVPLNWDQTANVKGDVLFNNLCAVCHGTNGKGDGVAVSAIAKHVPDLTTLSNSNDGVYPHQKVKRLISGESRTLTHGDIDMPVWGQQFMYVRSGWSSFTREAYARERIHTLSVYLESLQVN